MIQIQNRIRKYVKIKSLQTVTQYISCVDAIYTKNCSLAVIITFDYKTKRISEWTHAITKNINDYKPGFLAFHELPTFFKSMD